MDNKEQETYALDYIANHPTMEPRTKTLLAEVVKGELTTAELVDLFMMLAGVS